MSKLHVFTN